ncbi:type IVB secretion system protein IcmH/DotU [Azospirillum sp. TSO22-1]|uniref:type IVB secretion system protein IcmH/DotU n=1 Tax=Azospirillum sp. TSO22-1 TaxID=716789 RepID=UPI000D65E4E7|nr:type IVB secretion system protein IcmH/DotU [Azospirillum sp. TSO22-1]
MPDDTASKTVLRGAAAAASARLEPAPAPVLAELSAGAFLRASWNPLLAASAPLLDLGGRLRDLPSHPDPNGLRERLVAEIRRFEQAASVAGIAQEEIRVGRFALCATLDDVVLATPWGPRSSWSRDGLVATIERTNGAADRFFDFLEVMLTHPHLHRRELELFYACLSLGFEGKFRDRPRGSHDLNHLRDNLYRLLRRERVHADRTLSPAWKGVAERFRPLGAVVPPWVLAALVAAALTGLFLALAGLVTERADPVVGRLAVLLPERPIEITRLAPPPPPDVGPALVTRIRQALAPEIATNDIEVLPAEDGALIVRVRGGNLFPAGSDTLRARYRAVVERIGQTLGPINGHLVVVGHTDDLHVRSVRFATPQALTEAQAEAVRTILERHFGSGRLTSEGHGGSEPLVPNTSATSRAANRRVDLHFYPN